MVLRTTLIAGFPTESEEDFAELCKLVEEVRFDRLGCFAYSQEEDTPAAELEQIPEEVRRRRAEIIMLSTLPTGAQAVRWRCWRRAGRTANTTAAAIWMPRILILGCTLPVRTK